MASIEKLLAEMDALRRRVAELERAALEHKHTEEALRDSEGRARALLEAASEGIVIVDRRGHIVLANAKTGAIFGYAREELIGQPVEILVPERMRDIHTRHRMGYSLDPRVRPMGRGLDLVGLRKDGTEFPVEISLSFIVTEDGTQTIGFVTDITERLALERATRQNERLTAVGRLAAGIAHEVSYGIVQDHHGTIDVRSVPGRGTRFRLSFPPAPDLGQSR